MFNVRQVPATTVVTDTETKTHPGQDTLAALQQTLGTNGDGVLTIKDNEGTHLYPTAQVRRASLTTIPDYRDAHVLLMQNPAGDRVYVADPETNVAWWIPDPAPGAFAQLAADLITGTATVVRGDQLDTATDHLVRCATFKYRTGHIATHQPGPADNGARKAAPSPLASTFIGAQAH